MLNWYELAFNKQWNFRAFGRLSISMVFDNNPNDHINLFRTTLFLLIRGQTLSAIIDRDCTSYLTLNWSLDAIEDR